MGLLGHMVSMFIRNHQQTFKVAETLLYSHQQDVYSHQQDVYSSHSASSPALGTFRLLFCFTFSHSSEHTWHPTMVLTCISLISHDVEHLFTCFFLAKPTSCLARVCSNLCPFKKKNYWSTVDLQCYISKANQLYTYIYPLFFLDFFPILASTEY